MDEGKIVASCPKCRARFRIAESTLDKTRKCRKCGATMKLVPSASVHRPKPPKQARVSAGRNKGQPEPKAGPTPDKFLIVTISAAISITIVSIVGLIVLKGVIAAATPYVVTAFGIVVAGAVIGLIIKHKHAPKIRELEQELQIANDVQSGQEANIAERDSEISELEERLAEISKQVEGSLADGKKLVTKLAEAYLREREKDISKKLNHANYVESKGRLTKAMDFCEEQGYVIPKSIRAQKIGSSQNPVGRA